MKFEGNKKLALTLVMLGVIISFFGGSLAYWQWEVSESEKTEVSLAVTQDFTCTIDGGGNIESSDYQLIPTGCLDPDYAIQREVRVSSTLMNTPNNVILDMWIDINTLNSGLSNSWNFKYVLSTRSDSCTSGIISSGTFNGLTANQKTEIILNRTFSETSTEIYYLYIWLDKMETSGETMAQEFSLSLNGMCANGDKGDPYYVVYSETDNSLRFYDFSETITEGSTYNNLVSTKVYTAYENDSYGYNSTTKSATSPWYEQKENVTKIVVEDEISPKSTAFWFVHFTKVTSLNLTKLNTSEVTNMSRMFQSIGDDSSVTSLEIVGLDDWDTSKVTNMRTMFQGAGRYATTWDIGDLSGWNTSNVTDMAYMFNVAGMNSTTWDIGDLSGWDTSKVTSMKTMFQACGRSSPTFDIGDLSEWNTSKVTTMYGMFNMAGQNSMTFDIGDLSGWDTSNVTDMAYMFDHAGRYATTWDIGDLSGWNTSNVTDMFHMFYYTGTAATWSQDLSGWNTSKVTSYDGFNEGVESKVTPPVWVN